MDTSTTYQKTGSHEAKKGEFDTCLLLYSGGLDTSVMLKWIQEQYDADVIALTIDIGQLHEDLEEARLKALTLGAKEAHIVDAKDRFADELLTKAVKANADYQGNYHLSCPLGRVIISQIAVEKAQETGATVIAHGCTGKGNDQVRFESYITALDPTLKTLAPVREWAMGRDEEIERMKNVVREAMRVCEEGLAQFPGSTELKRMVQRATRIEREERLREPLCRSHPAPARARRHRGASDR